MNTREKELRKIFDEQVAELGRAVRAFPWNDRAAYAAWLAQTYALLQHVTTYETMKAAATGPHQPERHRYALRRLREEGAHDQLALRDMEALGFQVGDFPVLEATKFLLQSQYFWLHQSSLCHEGYVLLLEGLAAEHGEFVGKELKANHPEKSLSFVRVHAAEDDDHYSDGIAEVAKGSEAEIALTVANLRQSTALYMSMLRDIAALVAASGQKKAA